MNTRAKTRSHDDFLNKTSVKQNSYSKEKEKEKEKENSKNENKKQKSRANRSHSSVTSKNKQTSKKVTHNIKNNSPSTVSISLDKSVSLSPVSSSHPIGVQTRNQTKRLNQHEVFNENGKRTRANLKDLQIIEMKNKKNDENLEGESKYSLNQDLDDTKVEEDNTNKILAIENCKKVKREKRDKNEKNAKNQISEQLEKNSSQSISNIQTRKKKKLGGEESYQANSSSILKISSLLLKKKKCSICLELILNSATISSCKHDFCLPCLRSWVLKASTCPMCRESFTNYTYNQNYTGKEVSVQISEKEFSDYSISDESFLSTAESCMICRNSNNENLLLVCDGCRYNLCHTYCTNMDRIPDGDWLCAECVVIKYSIKIRPGQREKLLKLLNEDSEEESE